MSPSRAAQVNDAAKLQTIRGDVLQLMYDAGLSSMIARIPLGVQLGWLGAAAVAASLSTPDHTVTEADVRGGAARPLLPVCERRPPSPRAREAVVRNTASRRSAI